MGDHIGEVYYRMHPSGRDICLSCPLALCVYDEPTRRGGRSRIGYRHLGQRWKMGRIYLPT